MVNQFIRKTSEISHLVQLLMIGNTLAVVNIAQKINQTEIYIDLVQIA